MTQLAPRREWSLLSPDPEALSTVSDAPISLARDLLNVKPARPILRGDAETFYVGLVLQLLAATRKSGLLIVTAAGCERGLFFVEGNIAWASSTNPAERVSEQLCRLDLDRAPLPGGGLRDAVLDRQIEGVVRGLLTVERGTFTLFKLPRVPVPREAALDTQQLLLRLA